MDIAYNHNIFYGHLIKGHLKAALAYISHFPEMAERRRRYFALFEEQRLLTYDVDTSLNSILAIYQQYFRDAFYLELEPEQCAENLRCRFISFFGIADRSISLSEIENTQIAPAFEAQGFHFLGGRTGGYWGPYIWRTTEARSFPVALPDGIQEYRVNFLDGFLLKSWLDYLSFGEVGTGGWTDADGLIHCVKSSYDLCEENFTVSLLKHEAQHAMDLVAYPRMSSEDLEYRAKLVELIYSKNRNLLCQFLHEADNTHPGNGHGMAAARIIREFAARQTPRALSPEDIPIEQIQSTARSLFASHNVEIKTRYSR